jgi:hypothetical protein
MNVRITLDEETLRKAEARAADLGISVDEYVRRVVANDQSPAKKSVDMSVFFNLVTDGPPSNIARDKDKMVAEAVWEDHLRSTGRPSRKIGRKPFE